MNTMDAFEAGVSGVVGALQYNFDPSHQHWHYLALDRYDLRSHDSSLTEVARDQKTGFCLVQSSAINPTDCQHNNPSALSVSETINPGFSDIYDPARDGEYIDVTGLNGTYEFVQRRERGPPVSDMGPAATHLGHGPAASTPPPRRRRSRSRARRRSGTATTPASATHRSACPRNGAPVAQRQRPGGGTLSTAPAPGWTGWRTSSATSGAAATRPAGTAPTSPARDGTELRAHRE